MLGSLYAEGMGHHAQIDALLLTPLAPSSRAPFPWASRPPHDASSASALSATDSAATPNRNLHASFTGATAALSYATGNASMQSKAALPADRIAGSIFDVPATIRISSRPSLREMRQNRRDEQRWREQERKLKQQEKRMAHEREEKRKVRVDKKVKAEIEHEHAPQRRSLLDRSRALRLSPDSSMKL